MKPKQQVIYERLDYWECMDPQHRHDTESEAQKCIDIADGLDEAGRRNGKILTLRLAGATYAHIGAEFGVSTSRARDVVERYKRMARTELRRSGSAETVRYPWKRSERLTLLAEQQAIHEAQMEKQSK